MPCPDCVSASGNLSQVDRANKHAFESMTGQGNMTCQDMVPHNCSNNLNPALKHNIDSGHHSPAGALHCARGQSSERHWRALEQNNGHDCLPILHTQQGLRSNLSWFMTMASRMLVRRSRV
ncbi:hypothetical protein LIA77_02285 [Sarocladium implicatum]|nr:hypothetical protein LIA77_02285 [Sarocladium implicatum]